MHTFQVAPSSGRHAHPPSDDLPPARRDDRRPTLAEDTTEGSAPSVAELRQQIADLRRRLATEPTIEQAKGILVGFYGTDPDTAFAVLVRWSQHTNTKLHLVAAALVSAASHASAQPCTDLHHLINQLTSPGLKPTTTGRDRY